MEKLLKNIVKQIQNRTAVRPTLAVILGSGLGSFASAVKDAVEIPYSSLKGMPVSTVKGHSGKFIVGNIEGVDVIVMQGRIHLYEGYEAKQVVLPIYIFKELGVKTLIVTNASGGVNENYKAGDLMIINDQINLTGKNPLVGGPIVDYNGVQFVDMSEAYSQKYIEVLNEIGKKHNMDLKNGTYLQLLGPSYETPAEVRMARIVGADAVGMSTAVEVIAAKQVGLEVLGISAIANVASGLIKNKKLTHQEVLATMQLIGEKFSSLLLEFVKTLK
ncbi:MAG: purine-nucleoside phosphorylase [Spirochaetales bacterium]